MVINRADYEVRKDLEMIVFRCGRDLNAKKAFYPVTNTNTNQPILNQGFLSPKNERKKMAKTSCWLFFEKKVIALN